MSTAENDLTTAAMDGDFCVVKAKLKAGANVNGHPELPHAPIVAATIANNAGMVNFLLKHGADPDRPVTKAAPCPRLRTGTTIPGERALHIAASCGMVEIVRLLLKRSSADPNTTDSGGWTPLYATCIRQHVCVEVVRLLLEAGADPTLATENGPIPLQVVALNGHIDLVDMLYSKAPATLNRFAANGGTPLFVACDQGDESMVSKLLSLGAMQPVLPDESGMCPLRKAVAKGFVGVVRIMINEGGIRAVGGNEVLAKTLGLAVRFRQARILRLLLAADGERKRSAWANMELDGTRLLHAGAGFLCPAEVSTLLEAGADETEHSSDGCIPLEAIGIYYRQGFDVHRRGDDVQTDREKEVAIRRMLQRGPAYRARSWAWPSGEKAAHAGGIGDDDTAAAAVTAAAAAAVLSFPPAAKPLTSGLRIFRQQEKTGSQLFVKLVSRYCAKG